MPKTNPFEKFLGPEDHLHRQVLTLMAYQWPKVKVHHSPNEGKRSAFERFKFSWLGGDSGFPDLLIVEWKTVIELKSEKGKLSDSQWQWLLYFQSLGWDTLVSNDFNDVEKFLRSVADKFKK